jgi:hypothetical protein
MRAAEGGGMPTIELSNHPPDAQWIARQRRAGGARVEPADIQRILNSQAARLAEDV